MSPVFTQIPYKNSSDPVTHSMIFSHSPSGFGVGFYEGRSPIRHVNMTDTETMLSRDKKTLSKALRSVLSSRTARLSRESEKSLGKFVGIISIHYIHPG